MSNIIIIIQILFITIGMIALGMILNYFLGLRKDALREMRQKALNLQERMRNAQVMGDYQMMAQLQRESLQFMKLMTKKQLVPMCLRCLIFIGIFVVLGFVYSDYNSGLLPVPLLIFGSGWLAWYLIFSLYFSLIIYGVKRLIRMGSKEVSSLKQIMEIISPTRAREVPYQADNELPRTDSWKERIKE
jgi:uncharacterized membrane protein (DUF106 family)